MNSVRIILLLWLLAQPAQRLVAQSAVPKLKPPPEETTTTAPRPQPPAATGAAPAMGPEDEVERVETTLITVPVSVLDRTGKFITDLRREDFHIYENGVEQQLAYFAPVEQPFTVFLLLDVSGSTDVHLKNIQAAAIAFIDQLRPSDRVVVATFDQQVQVLNKATNDRNALREAIRQTRTGGGTRLYDTIDVLFKRVLNRIPGRKAVVLLTDGWDTGSRATAKTNLQAIDETDVLIYPIMYDARQHFGGKTDHWSEITSIVVDGRNILADMVRGEEYLGKLANKTGGQRYRADKLTDMAQSFAAIAEALRRQYSLGYYLKAAVKPGERRSIKVRIARKNVAVKTRAGYIYHPPGQTAK